MRSGDTELLREQADDCPRITQIDTNHDSGDQGHRMVRMEANAFAAEWEIVVDVEVNLLRRSIQALIRSIRVIRWHVLHCRSRLFA